MNRLKSIVMAALAVVMAATYVLPALPAAAADTDSSASLSIAPKKNYVIDAGKSVKDKLLIRNLDTANTLELTLRIVDFTFTNDSGTPKLFLDPNAPQTTWSLKPFLTIPESVTIAPGGSKSLDMSVAIPKGHGAGSYYSAIVYSTGAPNGGNVSLAASGVTLVFTQIPGLVNENMKLQKFGAYHEPTASAAGGYSFITTKEPQEIGYTLKNSGNVVESPVGSITLKDLFGRETDITNVNPSGSLALIGQARTFTTCIKLATQDVSISGSTTKANTCASPGLWPGYYSAKLDLYYGQNGNVTQEILGSSSFWYIPWWFVIAVIVVLLIVAYFVWRIVRIVKAKTNRGSHVKKSSSRK